MEHEPMDVLPGCEAAVQIPAGQALQPVARFVPLAAMMP
jgi:hypothetical protein